MDGTKSMKPFPEGLLGTWGHGALYDGDDYVAHYTIKLRNGRPSVTAVDVTDGEKFKISNVSWDGKWLRFKSYMPSTKRSGVNEFRLAKGGALQSRFTFTVLEVMSQVPSNKAFKRTGYARRLT